MIRFKTAAIGLSIVLFVFSCASQKIIARKLPPKFQGMVLSKDVDDSGKMGVPIEKTNSFNIEDEHVIALVSLKNLSGTHHLRWEWVDPNGKVYMTTDNCPISATEGKYLPKVTAWHRISLRDEAAADIPGQWFVKLYIDDELMDTKSFMLTAVADTLALPPGAVSKSYPK